MLKHAGAKVIGPFSRAEQAREAVRRGANLISAAVLDINIAGVAIYPPAEELYDADGPFIFATGYDPRAIPAAFAGVRRLWRSRSTQTSCCERL